MPAQWYSRSAALLESVGDQRAAVRAYARAEDWGAVARLIQIRGTGPDAGATGTDLLLPPSVVEQDPWLSLAEARRRVREGALDRRRRRGSAGPRACWTNRISATTADGSGPSRRCGRRTDRPA